jgi:hypothetical protein
LIILQLDLFLFLLAHIQGIVNLEVYGRPVLLGDLLLPQVRQQLIRLIPLGVEIQSQVVHSLISGPAIVESVLNDKVLGLVQDACRGAGDVHEAGHEFGNFDVLELGDRVDFRLRQVLQED